MYVMTAVRRQPVAGYRAPRALSRWSAHARPGGMATPGWIRRPRVTAAEPRAVACPGGVSRAVAFHRPQRREMWRNAACYGLFV